MIDLTVIKIDDACEGRQQRNSRRTISKAEVARIKETVQTRNKQYKNVTILTNVVVVNILKIRKGTW